MVVPRVLKLLAERDSSPGSGERRLRIWSAGCSTGEEPYSLAMTVVETLGVSAPVKLVCSDIDTKVLATASRGVYPADARGLSPERLRRHCQRGTGANAGFMRIRPELAKLIEFRTHNLMAAQWSLGEPFDIVFCRNVMIYFDARVRTALTAEFERLLDRGGLLMIGHAESLLDLDTGLRALGGAIYEK